MATIRMTLDEAKKSFPFLAQFKFYQSKVEIKVDIKDIDELSSMRPRTLEDHTIHSGFENHNLFVVGEDGALKQVGIRLGETIIYQARNMNPREERDDVYEDGESVGEALSRVSHFFNLVVLHSWGRTRFSNKDYKSMIGDDFEKLTIARFPKRTPNAG